MEFAFEFHNTRFLKCRICLKLQHKISQICNLHLNFTRFHKCGIYFWITHGLSRVEFAFQLQHSNSHNYVKSAFKLHNISQMWNLHLNYTRFLKYEIYFLIEQCFSDVEFGFKIQKVSQIWNWSLNYTRFLKLHKISQIRKPSNYTNILAMVYSDNLSVCSVIVAFFFWTYSLSI